MFVDEPLGFHAGVYYNAVCRVVNKPNIERFHLIFIKSGKRHAVLGKLSW